jgi:anti-sigma B factor antagonist
VQFESRKRGEVTVIRLAGSLDSASAASIQADLGQLIPDVGTTVLDLGEMTYMSSAGLRVLLLTHRQAQESGARIVLVNLASDVREVMSATGFLDFFEVMDPKEAEVLA